MATFPLTPEGHKKLKDELHHLKTVERPKTSLEIGAARELGDLSENFEYHAAKDRQGMIEARVRDLEDKLARVQVIDPLSLSGERVVFGATVTLLDIENDTDLDNKSDIQLQFRKYDSAKILNSYFINCITSNGYYKFSKKN